MPLQLQGAECRRSTYAWAVHGMKRIDGYHKPTIEFAPALNPTANTAGNDAPSSLDMSLQRTWSVAGVPSGKFLHAAPRDCPGAEEGKSLTPA